MTEKLQPLSTQIAIPSQTPFATPVSVSIHPSLHKAETVEEEPYTIKCICNFSDDDGNTIYCETCDTWQHIDCFYPDNREEAYRDSFAHSCAECKPRALDRQRAIERTQRLRHTVVHEETADKKPKRPPTKNQKKKPKPNELQLNGTQPGHESTKHGSPNDQPPPAKKAKTSHRPSHSISSQPAKRSPSYGTSKNHTNGHPPSPATTPPDLPLDFEIHNYSAGFFSLCNDQSVKIAHNNEFASLAIPRTMSSWLREPERMREETGQEFKDVFQNLPADAALRKRSVQVREKKHQIPGSDILQRHLVSSAAIEKDAPLMELNGQIGFQKDYCAESDNLWDELTSPLPFVFFHPMLPLYIDTRKEGSEARYVRRSCKPNAVLDTFLSGGSQYHFWLVSDRHIAADEQITLPWDFRFPKKGSARMLHLLGLGEEELSSHEETDMDDAEYQAISSWLHRILSEYGGCACDLGSNCAFARFHRLYLGKSHTRANGSKKKSRKQKTHTISPTSTGHATNSRAPSEGRLDEGHDNDAGSTSESRSKPTSRDQTPVRQGSLDQLGILTEPTDRDKRKVAMVEDSFRRMEQQQPPRKKKRASDGAGAANSTKPKPRIVAASSSILSNGVSNYVDAGTSRSKSVSPASGLSPSAQYPPRSATSRTASVAAPSRQTSVGPRPNYCDAAVQTDPVEGTWYAEQTPTPKRRRRIISLSHRLMNTRHRLRADEEERRIQPVGVVAGDSPTNQRTTLGSPVTLKDPEIIVPTPPMAEPTPDHPMNDAPYTSPTTAVPVALMETSDSIKSPVKIKTPDLRVQMPPVPAFGSPSGISNVTTPLSASGSFVQSPFSTTNLHSPFPPAPVNGVAHPSPVKKKLSLSDYTKSRMNKAAASKPIGTSMVSLKPSTSTFDESKLSPLDAIADSPTGDKPNDATSSQTGTQSSPSTQLP